MHRRGFRGRRLAATTLLAAFIVLGLSAPGVAPAAFGDSTTTTSPPATTQPTTTTTTAPPSATSPPSKPEELPSSTLSGAAADALRNLANQVTRNKHQIDGLTQQVADATTQLAQTTAKLAETQQKLDATRAEAARLRTIVKERAAFLYARAQAPGLAVADIEHVQDIGAGKRYAESATRTDGHEIEVLGRLADQLDHQREQLDAQQRRLAEIKTGLEQAKADLEQVTARQQKLLDQAGAIPVMGDPEVTAEHVTAWFQNRGTPARLAGGMPISELVQLYYEEGAAEHVRPDLAFAQSIIETGSFGHALDNNYAGIGACDSCAGEPAFPTPRDGVRGQIQLLRNYADPTSRAANLAFPPSPTIYGNNPFAAAASYDSFFAKGRVPAWNLMGNGNWATAPHYAAAVLGTYFEMVSFASRQK